MIEAENRRAGKRIHVAAAVVLNSKDEVLISLRPEHLHQGGLWEFPGGKVEAGETAETALRRELFEELDLDLHQCRPLIRIPHDYPDKSVLLDVWLCRDFSGSPRGKEGQQWCWVRQEALKDYPFPAANKPILNAVCLPDRYLITPDLSANPSVTEQQRFLERLEHSLQHLAGPHHRRMVQLRTKTLNPALLQELTLAAFEICKRHHARLLLNSDIDMVKTTNIDGVHLTSRQLLQCNQRPLAKAKLVAASCHNRQELEHAQALGFDFALLSPVKQTESHALSQPLGWEAFHAMVDSCAIPVYALGGMTLADLEDAFRHGAQGIAAISSLWVS